MVNSLLLRRGLITTLLVLGQVHLGPSTRHKYLHVFCLVRSGRGGVSWGGKNAKDSHAFRNREKYRSYLAADDAGIIIVHVLRTVPYDNIIKDDEITKVQYQMRLPSHQPSLCLETFIIMLL